MAVEPLRRVGHVALFFLGHIATHIFVGQPPDRDIEDHDAFVDYHWRVWRVATLFWVVLAWILIFGFYLLDHSGTKRFRALQLPRQDIQAPSFSQQLPTAIVNMTAFVIGGFFLTYFPVKPTADTSLLATAISFVKVFAVYDILLYAGHVAMHAHAPVYRMFRQSHQKHHSSWALSGISAYYMAPIDAFLEHFIMHLVFFVWDEIGPAFPAIFAVGVFNTICTHSGWDIDFLADPKQHWLHHAKVCVLA